MSRTDADARGPAALATRPARERAMRAFQEHFGRRPAVVVRAPGRVNLLGAHVDHSQGWVLPAAIDRCLWLAAAPHGDDPGRLRLWADDLGQGCDLSLDHLDPPVGERAERDVRWWDYAAGVAWVLAGQGRELFGIDGAIASDIPQGAGVSSSAALEMAVLLAIGAGSMTGKERALVGQRVENAYLGVASGIMDQHACLHGVRDHLILLDCRTLEHELLPLPAGTGFLVADSGVRRRLAESGYGDRRQESRQALELLRRHLPQVATLRDVSVAQLDRHAGHLPPPLARRARHVVEECARVLEGAAAVRRGDLPALGRLIQASHCSSRDLYQVSIPELDLLAETAWSAPGCHGAHLSGGGFGGCVVALVETTAATAVARAMQQAFRHRFGRTPDLFACTPADGAELLALETNR